MIDPEKQEGVYGENHAREEEARAEPGIREKIANQDENKGDTARDLDAARESMLDEDEASGGMGRTETPREKAPAGGWTRPTEEQGE